MATTARSKTRKAQADASSDALLFRYKAENSPSGVTRQTAQEMAKRLGLKETAMIHFALRSLCRQLFPAYDPDVEEVPDEGIAQLRARFPGLNGEDLLNKLILG